MIHAWPRKLSVSGPLSWAAGFLRQPDTAGCAAAGVAGPACGGGWNPAGPRKTSGGMRVKGVHEVGVGNRRGQIHRDAESKCPRSGPGEVPVQEAPGRGHAGHAFFLLSGEVFSVVEPGQQVCSDRVRLVVQDVG